MLHTYTTHLVWTDSAEGFFRRVRGQGKRMDFGQMGLYIKLHARRHTCTQAMQEKCRRNTQDQKCMQRISRTLQSTNTAEVRQILLVAKCSCSPVQ